MRNALSACSVVIVIAASALGCGTKQASQTTCEEFAEMDPHTGLATGFSDKQMDTLKDLLKENHAISGQEMQAGLQIIAYCNIVDGKAGSNQDQPIKNIPGLQ